MGTRFIDDPIGTDVRAADHLSDNPNSALLPQSHTPYWSKNDRFAALIELQMTLCATIRLIERLAEHRGHTVVVPTDDLRRVLEAARVVADLIDAAVTRGENASAMPPIGWGNR